MQTVSIGATVSAMQQLQMVFGGTPRAVLLGVLLDNDGDAARASDALLSGADGTGLGSSHTHRRVVVDVGPGLDKLWATKEGSQLQSSDVMQFVPSPDGIRGRVESLRLVVESGPLHSEVVEVHVVRAPEVVHFLAIELGQMRSAERSSRSLIAAIDACAAVLATHIGAAGESDAEAEAHPTVVVTQGIKEALNKWASDADKPFQNEMPLCVPAVLVALQLNHNVVALNATTKEAVKHLLGAFWCDARDRLLLTHDA